MWYKGPTLGSKSQTVMGDSEFAIISYNMKLLGTYFSWLSALKRTTTIGQKILSLENCNANLNTQKTNPDT